MVLLLSCWQCPLLASCSSLRRPSSSAGLPFDRCRRSTIDDECDVVNESDRHTKDDDKTTIRRPRSQKRKPIVEEKSNMVRLTLSSSILSTAMLVSCETSSAERPRDGAGYNEVLPRRHRPQNHHSRLSRRSKGRTTRLLEMDRSSTNLTLQRDREKQQWSGGNTRWRRIAQSKPTCPDEWELRGPSVGYKAGDVVSAPKSKGSNDGFVFSCKPWPMSGHCNQRGFEPMVDSA